MNNDLIVLGFLFLKFCLIPLTVIGSSIYYIISIHKIKIKLGNQIEKILITSDSSLTQYSLYGSVLVVTSLIIYLVPNFMAIIIFLITAGRFLDFLKKMRFIKIGGIYDNGYITDELILYWVDLHSWIKRDICEYSVLTKKGIRYEINAFNSNIFVENKFRELEIQQEQ